MNYKNYQAWYINVHRQTEIVDVTHDLNHLNLNVKLNTKTV